MHWTQDPKNKAKLRRARARGAKAARANKRLQKKQSAQEAIVGVASAPHTRRVTLASTFIMLRCDKAQQQAVEQFARALKVPHEVVKL